MSVGLSVCMEEEQKCVSGIYGLKVLKVLKFTQFYVLSMETTHCHAEVYMSG